MAILLKDRKGYANICKDIPLPAAAGNSGSSGLVVSIIHALRFPLPQDQQCCCSLPPSRRRQFESRLQKVISINFMLWWRCIPSAYWVDLIPSSKVHASLWSAEFSRIPKFRDSKCDLFWICCSSRGLRTPKVERSKNQRVLLSLGPPKRTHRPTVFKCYTAGVTCLCIPQSISKPC